MQSIQNLIDISVRSEKVVRRENFRMTSRDLDILEFILEMKFSTIEDIHSNFFKFTKDGEQSSCLRWARERVSNLVRSENYTLLNSKISYRATKFSELFLSAENLFDIKYETNKYYTMPGITIFGGIKVRL